MTSSAHAHDSQQEIRRATILAVLILAALGVAIAIFVHRGARSSDASVEVAAEVPAAHGGTASRATNRRVTHIPRSRPELVRGAANRDARNPRVAYASELHRRLREKGHRCSIGTSGEMYRDLVVSWRPNQVDRDHMEQLQRAQGFRDILRSKHFENLVLKIGDKVVWSTKL